MKFQPNDSLQIVHDKMLANKFRQWTRNTLCEPTGVHPRQVRTSLDYLVTKGEIHHGKIGRWAVYSVEPLPPEIALGSGKVRAWTPEGDVRIPKVVQGWRPPVMVPPRV